jgi:hypothetical protein
MFRDVDSRYLLSLPWWVNDPDLQGNEAITMTRASHS